MAICNWMSAILRRKEQPKQEELTVFRPKVVAEIEGTNLVHSYLLNSSIVLDDPTLLDYQWAINGEIVQRQVVSQTHDGKPKVVVIWCPVVRQQGNFVLKTISAPLPPPLSPRNRAQMKAVMRIGGKDFTATYDEKSATLRKSGQHVRSYIQFKQFENAQDKVCGIHFYVTYYPEGQQIAIRLSNGTLNGADGSGFCGQVFFEDAYLELNAVKYILVPKPGKHVIFPMHQTHRRYSFGAVPYYERAVSGSCFHLVGGYGAEMQKLPKYTADYTYENLTGFQALRSKHLDEFMAFKACVNSGKADPGIEMHSPRIGLFHPYYLGDSGSGAPGGFAIHPMSGLGQSQIEIDLLKLKHQTMTDRHSIACFDSSGNYIDAHAFTRAGGGVQPFYHNVIGAWKEGINEHLDAPPYFKANMGKSWNQGQCDYIGAKYQGGLRDYEYIDDAHYCRATKFAKGLAYLTGDELAIDDHRHAAEFLLFSWGIYPHVDLGWTKGHSVGYQIEFHSKNPHNGGWLSRDFGWTLHTLADAYVLASDSWRSKNLAWFKAVEKLFDLSAMPSGIWQREASVNGAFDDGKIPKDQDLCGAIYIGIVSAGALGLIKGVLGASDVMASIFARLIPNFYDVGPFKPVGPAYWASVATKGQAPYATPKHFSGGLEAYNGYWAMMAAFEATKDVSYFDRLKSYGEVATSHDERVKKLFKAASGWDDKIENAGFYIAKVQSP